MANRPPRGHFAVYGDTGLTLSSLVLNLADVAIQAKAYMLSNVRKQEIYLISSKPKFRFVRTTTSSPILILYIYRKEIHLFFIH